MRNAKPFLTVTYASPMSFLETFTECYGWAWISIGTLIGLILRYLIIVILTDN